MRHLLTAGLLPLLALATPAASQSSSQPTQCSADALPAGERAAMQREYARRVRSEGKARADAWVQQQARDFRQRLVEQGICPAAREGADRVASADRSEGRDVPKGKDGKACRTTRLEHRNIANPGGGAMMMVLVPVCAD